MNSGRHFNPPTPAYRPVDPFTGQAPRSAELVPSCETVTPPPARIRPVRVDPAEPPSSSERVAIPDPPVRFSQADSSRSTLPLDKKLPAKAAPVVAKSEVSAKKREEGNSRKASPPVAKGPHPSPAVENGQEVRTCAWARCGKTFVVQANGRNAVRRYCSATCRGRASEARTGKR